MKRSLTLLIGVTLFVLLLAGTVATLFFMGENHSTDSPAGSTPLLNFQETKSQAEGGNARAQNLLGEIYAEGKQMRQDYAQAAHWYRKAADQGLDKAQYNLGVLHDIGQGVERNESEAAQWYHKAAEAGNTDAQYTLASMYGLGRGVPRDAQEALKWYRRAAEQGDALARYNLAERYERGRDVAPDLVEAFKWHSLAADLGLQDAETARRALDRKMTSEQLAEARKRIHDFNLKFPSNGKKR